MVTIPTRDGGTVTVIRCGALVDIHVRDAEGRTIATVTRRAGEAARLLSAARLRAPEPDTSGLDHSGSPSRAAREYHPPSGPFESQPPAPARRLGISHSVSHQDHPTGHLTCGSLHETPLPVSGS